jgi:hypothetical protein
MASGSVGSRPSRRISGCEAIKRVNAEKETLGEIARSYNVSRWTISRLAS